MAEPQTITPTTKILPTGSTTTITNTEQPDRFEQGEDFVANKFHRFAYKADSLYSSEVYKKLRPENKKKVDEAIYNKYKDVAHFMGRAAPAKEWWHSQTAEQKLAFIKNTQTGKASEDFMTAGDTGNYLLWRNAKAVVEAAQGTLKAVSGFGKSLGMEQQDTAVSKSINKFLDTQKKAVDAEYNNVWAGRINNHMATQLAGGMVGFIPTALALYYGGSNKVLGETKVVADEIAAAGGLTKFLATNPKLTPFLNTAVRAVKGAYDGYIADVATGGNNTKDSMAGWAAFEVASPAVAAFGKGVFNTVKGATATAYAKLAAIHGPELLKESIMKDVPEEFKNLAHAKDPLVEPLHELNAKVRNDFTKHIFNKPMYQFLTKEQKQEVNLEIIKVMQTGFKYPAAFNKSAVGKTMAEQAVKSAKIDPQVGEILSKLEENSKAIGGKDKEVAAEQVQRQTANAVKDASTQTKYNKNVTYPVTNIAKKPVFQIGRGGLRENVGVQFPDQEHADLYSALGRRRKALSGGIAKGPNIDTVAKRWGMTRSELLDASEQYRKDINAAIKDWDTEKGNFKASVFEVSKNEPDALKKYRISGTGPGAASRYDPGFIDSTWSTWLSQKPIFENVNDNLLVDYWKAKNRPNLDPALRQKYIAGFLDALPDDVDADEYIAGSIEGMTEHLHMMHETEYLNRFAGIQGSGQAGHVFRSGNYMADDLRKKYNLPVSEWQSQLREEYYRLMELRRKNPGATIHDVLAEDE